MNPDERYEQRDYAWGTFLGFLFFSARRLPARALVHLILLAVAGAVMLLFFGANAKAIKGIIFALVAVETALLAAFGFSATRMSWRTCNWKTPHAFMTSNSVWGFFGRLALLMRVLNVIGYVFLTEPGRVSTIPGWLVTVGYIIIPLVILLLIWRIRGPIWAVALNTLKESISKLEVVTLFIIGVVFVIMFNIIWHVPAVQESVVAFFKQSQPVTSPAPGSEEDESAGEFKVDTGPRVKGLIEEDIQKTNLRLQVQVAAFLFGELFIALICFAVGIFLITGEIQRGVVLTVLPKPIGRGEYVLGKMLGGWMIAVICFEAMGIVALLFALPYRGESLNNLPNIFQAMLLMPIKYAILIALITYLSLWLPEAAAGFVGITIFIAGHFSEKILDMAFDELSSVPLASQAMKAAFVMLPHLTWVFSPSILDPNWTDFTSAGPVMEWVFWAVIYFAVVATLAVFSFRKRSL